ncbi:hypothetical protein DL95DRAFT_78067 [Leptodontidium sp. 2 PMI_412]|nr:hypothetical protein DL95DRAFT_78067 [Leptodontidium sp. 2 PMI_412]
MDLNVRDIASTAALKIHQYLSPISGLRTRIASSDEKIKIDLLDYLIASRNRQATDPKDHVYGVLGLVNNIQTTLKPDYRFHVMAIFAEVTRQLIASTGNLDTLSACGHHPKLDNHRTYLEVYYAYIVVLRQCGSVIAKDFFGMAMERESIDILDSNPFFTFVGAD